jgi:hypothetical protein
MLTVVREEIVPRLERDAPGQPDLQDDVLAATGRQK